MFNKKKKSHVSIEINDYVLRALVMKGPSLEESTFFEMSLPSGVVEEASIKDEIELFKFFKENASQWGGKNQHVRFFVPDPTILLKSFDHPVDMKKDQLVEYVQMEIGQTIHLPFQEPLVDVYDPVENDGHAMLFAAAPEEVYKLTNLFFDINMNPEAADIRALCNLRLLDHMKLLKPDKTYLLANWLINEVSICIYSNGSVDFLRYQPISTDLSLWKANQISPGDVEFTYNGDIEDIRMMVSDQVLELDRIMNFFRFSLHKGEKSVDEIILMGDHPFLELIHSFLQDNLPVTISTVNDELINQHFPGYKAKFSSLIGLALKVI